MHIFVTLGSGVAAYVSGVLLSKDGRLGAAGPAFFLIAALVLPLGMAVTLDEAGLDPEELGLQNLISIVLMAAFLATYVLFRANSVLVYASVHVKSKALLTFGSLFLGAYLVKITSEYFSDSLGWPLALVIAGLLLMAVGYVTLRLKRTYLTD
jgi:hypothetical protein